MAKRTNKRPIPVDVAARRAARREAYLLSVRLERYHRERAWDLARIYGPKAPDECHKRRWGVCEILLSERN